MKSVVIKRSILINGRKTSVSLENEFWEGLREIADREMIAHSTLVEQIDQERDNVNLSSAIRVFVFNHFRSPGRVKPAGNFRQLGAKSMKLRAQADEYRVLAEGFKDTETRAIMLRVASTMNCWPNGWRRERSSRISTRKANCPRVRSLNGTALMQSG